MWLLNLSDSRCQETEDRYVKHDVMFHSVAIVIRAGNQEQPQPPTSQRFVRSPLDALAVCALS